MTRLASIFPKLDAVPSSSNTTKIVVRTFACGRQQQIRQRYSGALRSKAILTPCFSLGESGADQQASNPLASSATQGLPY